MFEYIVELHGHDRNKEISFGKNINGARHEYRRKIAQLDQGEHVKLVFRSQFETTIIEDFTKPY